MSDGFLTFGEVAGRVRLLVDGALPAAARMSGADWSATGTGNWSRLEVLGHLVDSAVNNHQRIVRAAIEGRLAWPGYAQIEHVRVGGYRAAAPGVVLEAWAGMNRLLAHVVDGLGEGQRGVSCVIDGAPAMPLAALVEDYLAHMEHHMRQIIGEKALAYSGLPWPPGEGSGRIWPK